MKMEKISDTQLKVYLSQQDLKERNIRLNELAYGSEKIQALFRELMEEAMTKFGFELENTPLMVEAMPISSENIILIVSKVSEDIDIENKFTLAPASKDIRHFRKNGINLKNKSADIQINEEDILIFSFDCLDNAATLCSKITDVYNGKSSLYKYDCKYFLVMLNQKSENDKINFYDFDGICSEYGQKHSSNMVAKCFLEEHAEAIIKNSAVSKLASYL